MNPGIPAVYADWILLVERFEAGDDAVLEAMEHGTLEWTNVVAQRWSAHISRAMTHRLQATSHQLQLGFSRANGDLFAVAKTMLGARRALTPLVRLASLPCIDNEMKKHLLAELTRFVTESQTSLEESAIRTGRQGDPVLRVLRENRLRLETMPERQGQIPPREQGIASESAARTRRTFLPDPNA